MSSLSASSVGWLASEEGGGNTIGMSTAPIYEERHKLHQYELVRLTSIQQGINEVTGVLVFQEQGFCSPATGTHNLM